MNISEIREKYKSISIEKAGCFLLDYENTLSLIQDIKDNNLILWGIEGYWLKENTIQPSLKNSIGFKNDIRLETISGVTPFEKAVAFMEDKKNLGLWFDISFEDIEATGE